MRRQIRNTAFVFVLLSAGAAKLAHSQAAPVNPGTPMAAVVSVSAALDSLQRGCVEAEGLTTQDLATRRAAARCCATAGLRASR